MLRDPSATFAIRLGRALRKKCPRCGAAAFDSFFTMKKICPGCGLKFERESGYWAGAIIINTTVIFATFLVTFAAGIFLTWPDVPWTGFLIFMLIINTTIPILFYPRSKTIWSAMELGWNPLEPAEIEAASKRLDS